MNHPMGPLTLVDFIGLDVCLAILNVLHEGLGDPKYRPCRCLRNTLMPAGSVVKAAKGFTIIQIRTLFYEVFSDRLSVSITREYEQSET